MTDDDDDDLPDVPLPGQRSLFAAPSDQPLVLEHAGQLASDKTYETIPPPQQTLAYVPRPKIASLNAVQVGDTWRWAHIGPDGLHRYLLGRVWDESKPVVTFCGLNPSTADGVKDDQTMRKEIGFAKLWGYGGLLKVNLFGWRATDPSHLTDAWEMGGQHVVGVENHVAIRSCASQRDVIACWGANEARHLPWPWQDGAIESTVRAPDEILTTEKAVLALIRSLARRVYHLGLTKEGAPRHPLYLPLATERVEWLP